MPSMSQSTRRHDLLKAFEQARCPVCQLVLRDMEKDLFNLYQDRINKVETHQLFRAGRGLCNAHAWQMAQAKGAAISVAVMYESTLFGLLKDSKGINMGAEGWLSRLPGRSRSGGGAADALAPSGPCLMCESMNAVEASYIDIIAENLATDELRMALGESVGGLCLPHSRMCIAQARTSDDARWLLDMQETKWRELQAQLEQFIQNNEDNIPHWQMGPEGDSWQRAVRYLSGEPEVFGYRR